VSVVDINVFTYSNLVNGSIKQNGSVVPEEKQNKKKKRKKEK